MTQKEFLDRPSPPENPNNNEVLTTNLWLPPIVLDNDQLARYLSQKGITTSTGKPLTRDGIFSTTGIQKRYALQELGEPPKPLAKTVPQIALQLANSTLKTKNWRPSDLDHVFFCSSYPFGIKVSDLVVNEIGARENTCQTKDVYAACASSTFALKYIAEHVEDGSKVLVIAAEHYTAMMGDDTNRTIFSDGGAALAFEKGAGFKFIWQEHVYQYNPAIRMPIDPEKVPPDSLSIAIPRSDEVFEMNGRDVMRFVLGGEPYAMINRGRGVVSNLGARRIYVIPHQGSGRILNDLNEKFKKDKADVEASALSVSQIGNLAAASVLAELHYFLAQNELKSQDTLLLFGFGAGLSSSGVAIQKD